jgi:tetratricopeptide (TPR) repeat protein
MHALRRIPLLLLAAALACFTPLRAATATSAPDPLLRDALTAEARFDSKTALDLFLKADTARPNDAFILQKIARQYSDLSFDTKDATEQKRLCTEALAFAQRSVALDPKNAVNVLSLAICYGKLGALSDTRTKIEYSRLVKDHAEQSLALDPAYDYAHHVLGRWNYEVATLGVATRFIVKLIYGGLPNASTAEAVRFLRRAAELAPQLPAHRVELGFALLADRQRDAAKLTFEQALVMPQREKYDDEARARARAALENLR